MIGGSGGGVDGGGAEGGTIPANWASSSRLMPLAVRKSAARSSPEHVSFPSATPVHRNGSTPSTLVLNEIAVWRPEMRSSFAFAGSGGQAGGGGGLGEGGGCEGEGDKGGDRGDGGGWLGGEDGGGGESDTHGVCT